MFSFILAEYRNTEVVLLSTLAILLTIQIYLFCRLTYLMRTRHYFEYKRHHKSMMVCFFVTVISQLMYIQYEFVGLATKIYDIDSDATIKMLCLDKSDPDAFVHNLLFVLNETINIYFQVPNLLIALTLSIFKRHDDILQGINKLDYLLKVSIFQYYKEENLNRNHFASSNSGSQIDNDFTSRGTQTKNNRIGHSHTSSFFGRMFTKYKRMSNPTITSHGGGSENVGQMGFGNYAPVETSISQSQLEGSLNIDQENEREFTFPILFTSKTNRQSSNDAGDTSLLASK